MVDLLLSVAIGEVLWDVFENKRCLGGAPLNFAYHLNQLGESLVTSTFVSRVGDDKQGDEIIFKLKQLNITTEFVQRDNRHPTGKVDVGLDRLGQPTYSFDQNSAWDFITLTDRLKKLAASTDIVCFGSLAQRNRVSSGTIDGFLKETRRNCLRIFDCNLRRDFYTKEVIENSLEYANILKINENELFTICNLFSICGVQERRLSQILERFDLKLIVLTMGEKGSLLFSPHESSIQKPDKIAIVDTVGAGDAFTAAVAIGLLKGWELDYTNFCANVVGGFVCGQKGATPRLPNNIKNLFKK